MKVVPVHVGDVVKLKKPHPCGSYDWEITKLGMDIGLECQGCGRAVRLIRSEFDRRFRGYVSRAGEAGTEAGRAGETPEEPMPDEAAPHSGEKGGSG